ncbi:MAG: hypothetical protein M1825_000842 [Sarcosagium campestre]|nr:MAG: hypothetical protein M1825_000842 [Sarcosagium campestre]
MCVAELNVALRSCGHRWYHLIDRCAPSHDLSNCPEKLALRGWETKRDFCPWCSGWGDPHGEFLRLLGGIRPSAVSGPGFTPPVSRRTSMVSARRESKALGSIHEVPFSDPLRRASGAQNRRQSSKIEAILPRGGFYEQNSIIIRHDEPAAPTPPPQTASSASSILTVETPTETVAKGEQQKRRRADSRVGSFRAGLSRLKKTSCGLWT